MPYGERVLDKIKMIQINENIEQSLIVEGELWGQYNAYRNNGDGINYRNKLVEHYMYFVEKVAKWVHNTLPQHIELRDLVQEGVFGLIDAIEKFDCSIGVKFETYGYPKIKGSILSSLRERDWVPRFVRSRNKQLEKARSKLNHDLSREDLIEELSKDDYAADPINKKPSVNLKRRKKALKIIGEAESIGKIKVFSEIFYEDRKEDVFLEDYRANSIDSLEKRELVASLIKNLTKPQQLVIDLYHYQNKELPEIAEIVGTTPQAVSQMRQRSIKWLKHWARVKDLSLEDVCSV